MGKRKERRLAAKSGAGRRVKLDLFEEQSGEMVETSLHDDVGVGSDKDHRAGVPNSPSSSGQRQENPLLLLGQYSDDDADEEASKRTKHEVDGSPTTDPNDQVKEPADAGAETVKEPADAGVESVSEPVKDITGDNDQQEPDQVDTVKKLDGNDAEETDAIPEYAQCSEVDLSIQMFVPEAPGMQIDADMSGGWKMVLDEQSNQYYYWNTVTGETSWEVPSILAQVSGEQNPTSSTGMDPLLDVQTSSHLSADLAAYTYVTGVDVAGSSNSVAEHVAAYGSVLEIGNENGGVGNLGYDANQSLLHYSTAVTCPSYQGLSAQLNYGPVQQPDNVLSEQLGIPLEGHLVSAGEYKDKPSTGSNEGHERTDVHSSRLVKYSGSLLQRLNALERSGRHLERYELIMKEIEIRQSDCEALSSYGSSLLPFWWHTEAQLKQLESAISKEETSLVQKDESKIETMPHNSSLKDEPPLQSSGEGFEVIEGKSAPCSDDNNCTSSNDASHLQTEDCRKMPDSNDVKTTEFSFGSTDQQLMGENEQVIQETIKSTFPLQVEVNGEVNAEEDMDMDVEMEVDEETPDQLADEIKSNVDCAGPADLCAQIHPSSSERPSVSLDECNVPPPPDEEWIPPPPPDNELDPPPPPEEPPVPLPPPPEADTVPYQDHYNFGYTVPTYEYYAPTMSEMTNGNYYAHTEVSQNTELQPQPYYEPMVTAAFPEVTMDVNPVEPITYYGIASVTVPTVPMVSTGEPSGFYLESGPISYHATGVTIQQDRSVGFAVEHGSDSLPNENMEAGVSGVTRESETGSSQALSVASSAQVTGTTSVNGSTTDTLVSAAPKKQSKVTRSKKHTVAVASSLRSNKKVSSLVDKWKAAKEELHGDEDEEPENPIERLEKKRQKEIEQWRARQIASGEAQDNANFVPLGGDWRERVKRKKAKTKAEPVQTYLDKIEVEKKLPDLVEFSKDLPSGWQAYWDESAKEVYYGNSITSETTWTRPTR